MSATILRANSRDLPLADNSVDLVVTSPPYFALRSYQDGGEHYLGQIGDEPTPAEFVESLLTVTRECVRVLKPSGSLWVNLGDKYDSGTNAGRKNGGDRFADGRERQAWNTAKGGPERATIGRPKSLIGIPWRYALRCIDDLGLILRAEVIWSKPNGLPESVTDRVRRSHETWFHFTLSPRYYSAVDEIREAHVKEPDKRPSKKTHAIGQPRVNMDRTQQNPLGKLPGSVWTIPTEPLHVPEHVGVDHFAAFPTEWPRRIIQGWSPAGVCVECGEGRRPVSDVESFATQGPNVAMKHNGDRGDGGGSNGRLATVRTITGEACACGLWITGRDTPPASRPGVVLDPFGGTGTTAMVAKALGRHGISVDMSADYCRLATWRTNDPKQLAKAARREFTPSEKPMDGQLGLFEEIA